MSKKCQVCNEKLYSIYIENSIESGQIRKWNIIGKTCKNKHLFINKSKIHFNNYKFKQLILYRTLYVKLYHHSKQIWKTIGIIWIDFDIEIDDTHRFDNGKLLLFFNYPIEKYDTLNQKLIF